MVGRIQQRIHFRFLEIRNRRPRRPLGRNGAELPAPLDVLGFCVIRQSEPTNGSQLTADSGWPRCSYGIPPNVEEKAVPRPARRRSPKSGRPAYALVEPRTEAAD